MIYKREVSIRSYYVGTRYFRKRGQIVGAEWQVDSGPAKDRSRAKLSTKL